MLRKALGLLGIAVIAAVLAASMMLAACGGSTTSTTLIPLREAQLAQAKPIGTTQNLGALQVTVERFDLGTSQETENIDLPHFPVIVVAKIDNPSKAATSIPHFVVTMPDGQEYSRYVCPLTDERLTEMLPFTTTTVTMCYGAEWTLGPGGSTNPYGEVVVLSGPIASLAGWIVTAEGGGSMTAVSWRGKAD